MGRKPRGGEKKKLEDAARHWVGGGTSLNEAIADLEAFGAPAEVIEELVEAQRREDFEVWPENWSAVEMFLRLETQWRVSFNGALGLDYTAAKWMFDLYAPPDAKDVFEALQVMERTALPLLNERSE